MQLSLVAREPALGARVVLGPACSTASGSSTGQLPRARHVARAPGLACGRKSIGARLARDVNRVAGRSGPVLDGRYHHRSLRSPREVRRALAYVLLNARRHLAKSRGISRTAAAHLDGASSARWFDGWRPEVGEPPPKPPQRIREVARPRTWLLRIGWRRHGLVDPAEVPGA